MKLGGFLLYEQAGIYDCLMCRLFKDNMLMHFVDIGKRPPVFEDAARVALELLQSQYEFDFGQLYYNVFRFPIVLPVSVIICRNYDVLTRSLHRPSNHGSAQPVIY